MNAVRESRFVVTCSGFWVLFLAAAGVSSATQLEVPTTNLEVDTSSRTAVLAFWNEYYKASEGAEEVMGWSGDHSTCNEGSNSLAYTEKVERRINFFRALAGLDANTLTNTGSTVVISGGDTHKPSASLTKQAAAQRAALMFSWVNELTHNPPQSYACWTSGAWNAAYRGNLAVGFHGPEAVDAYMRENDSLTLVSWDPKVGHRRWILKHGSTNFASGDVPGHLNLSPSNVLYVVQSSSETIDPPERFTAWPSDGYFPDALMATQWSLCHPSADFSSATVHMTDGQGSTIATSIVDQTTTNVGDPAIVWSVPPSVSSSSVSEDISYNVTISGIQLGGETVVHSYQVTVFDPDVLTEPLILHGTSNPPATGANYAFDLVEGASRHVVLASEVEAVDWVAGAEDGASDYIVDETGAEYSLRTSAPYVYGGVRSFRLRLPAAGPGQQEAFIIDREVIPGPGATITYHRRRGYMMPGVLFELQTSTDGRVWTTVDSVSGRSTVTIDPAFSLQTIGLAEGTAVKVRAIIRWISGSIFDPADSRSGIFLDDISFQNCEWAASTVEIAADEGAGIVRVDPASLGEAPAAGSSLMLRLSSEIGGVDYVSTTPLDITFDGTVDGFSDWALVNYPTLTGGFNGDHDGDGIPSGVEYAFGLSPIESSILPRTLSIEGASLVLSSPLDYQRTGVSYELENSTDLSNWSAAGSVVTWADGELRGTAPPQGGRGFVRWKVVEP